MILTRTVHLQEELATTVTYTSVGDKIAITVVVRRDELPKDHVPVMFECQLAEPVKRV